MIDALSHEHMVAGFPCPLGVPGSGSLCCTEALYLDTVPPVSSHCVLNNFSPHEKVTAHAYIIEYLSPRLPALVPQL